MLRQQVVIVEFFCLVLAVDCFQTDLGIRNCVDTAVEFGNLRVGFVQKLLLPLQVTVDHCDVCFQRQNARVGQLFQLLLSFLDSRFPLSNHLVLITPDRIELQFLGNHIRVLFLVLGHKVLQLRFQLRSTSGQLRPGHRGFRIRGVFSSHHNFLIVTLGDVAELAAVKRAQIARAPQFGNQRLLTFVQCGQPSDQRLRLRRQVIHVLLQIFQPLGIDGVQFFLCLTHLFFDELLGRGAGVDCSFCSLRIAAAISNVEAVGDFVARGVDFDLDLLAYPIDE